jgi:hypothetical protein
MSDYQKILDPITKAASETQIKRAADGAIIPFDDRNVDYQAYKAWVGKGGVPDEAAS